MSIIIDGTGSISGVSSTGLSSAQTVTQSAIATGVAGTGPVVSVYGNATQTISVNTNVLLNFNTKLVDTASRFNATGSTVGGIPAYAFMPNVAGYYQISFNVQAQTTSATVAILPIMYGNGVFLTEAIGSSANGSAFNYPWAQITYLVYLNGTTDYVQGYGQATGASGTQVILAGIFQAVLVRAA